MVTDLVNVVVVFGGHARASEVGIGSTVSECFIEESRCDFFINYIGPCTGYKMQL